jgi:hypothetical protein
MAINVGGGFVYLTHGAYYSAFGDVRMDGTMFDTVDGTVQTDVWFTGPAYADEDLLLDAITMSQIP